MFCRHETTTAEAAAKQRSIELWLFPNEKEEKKSTLIEVFVCGLHQRQKSDDQKTLRKKKETTMRKYNQN